MEISSKNLALQIMPMPGDSNPHGDVFGGWIMSQVDIAGSVPACQLAKGRVSTVAVTNFVFKQPVYIGDLVMFYANVTKVGKTSITVEVEVHARRNRFGDDVVKVTEATLVYVAIDQEGKPRPVMPE
jgi:acyl-CoA thioesterase YciA